MNMMNFTAILVPAQHIGNCLVDFSRAQASAEREDTNAILYPKPHARKFTIR
ncbi:hypothetical protein SDC9_175377 [bioreactor metagenome]|uniref:Uncharacterized protein n=1 Tax=bioreactor metagenome TaxID=1076179 RepID=A0A645GWB3_9ZZZZ